jgi:long-chain fatty acid transport protein
MKSVKDPDGRSGRRHLALSRSALFLAVFVLSAGKAYAAGFAINENSAAELGTANAGAAAAAEDATTIADNPAGLTHIDRPELVGSGTLIEPSLDFQNFGSRLLTGAPISGSNADGGSTALLPNVFGSLPVGGNVTVGLGIFPSFGLATDYPSDWVGRYQAITTHLTSFDIAPTVAYRVNPMLSLGLSPVARYTSVKYSNAIDFGTIGTGLGIPGGAPGANDGAATVDADAWSFGLNGGLLFEPTSTTRIGVAYFYSDAAQLKGTANFTRPAIGDLIAAGSGAFINTGASAALAYPDHLNIGVVQQLSPVFDVRGSVTWTQWSSFKQLLILFSNPNQPAELTAENWRDTYGVALGMTYRPSERWVLRTGISYDQSPIRDASFRTPRLPDASRITPAMGIGYELTETASLDLAYEHVFGGGVGLVAGSPTGDILQGETEVSADVVAVQLTLKY